jgi:hypothetical protein
MIGIPPVCPNAPKVAPAPIKNAELAIIVPKNCLRSISITLPSFLFVAYVLFLRQIRLI